MCMNDVAKTFPFIPMKHLKRGFFRAKKHATFILSFLQFQQSFNIFFNGLL